MAKWNRIGRSANKSETRACQYLETHLPDDYTLYSNMAFTEPSGFTWDYDVVLLGRHAVYVIEIKNYGGTIRGDQYQWVLTGPSTFTPPGDILSTVDNKARVLKAKLKQRYDILGRVYVHSVVCLTGRKGKIAIKDDPKRLERVHWLLGIEKYLTDENALPIPAGWNCKTDDITCDHSLIQSVLENYTVFKPLEKQQRIGDYEIMGIAWQARRYTALFAGIEGRYPPQALLKVYPVPEKTSRTEVKKVIRQFAREISALQKIRDKEIENPRSGVKNVIAAYRSFLHPDGRHYVMVMEWINGHLLSHKLQESECLSNVDRAKIAAQVCRGLGCAHSAGIVHRNLTPANVIVALDGTTKLINFDFAKFLPEPSEPHLKMDSVSSLTRFLDQAYMAPEIQKGIYHEANKATDIYAAGLILSELFTGVRPKLGKRNDGGRFDFVDPQARKLVSDIYDGIDISEIIGTMCAADPVKRMERDLFFTFEYCNTLAEAEEEDQR
jgi:serine/threonine protein kinase